MVDLQAKGYIANMTMHNGEFGCSTCLEPGIVVAKGKGHVRCYSYRNCFEKTAERTSDVKRKAQFATHLLYKYK